MQHLGTVLRCNGHKEREPAGFDQHGNLFFCGRGAESQVETSRAETRVGAKNRAYRAEKGGLVFAGPAPSRPCDSIITSVRNPEENPPQLSSSHPAAADR